MQSIELKGGRIGIVAGSGSLPREIAESLVRRGIFVHIAALEGAAAKEFGSLPQTRFRWGELSRLLAALRDNRVTHVVIIGGVKRPELGDIRLDLGFFLSLPTILRIIAAGGDDGVLRRVIRFFEVHGFTVIGPADAAPEIAIGEGPLGSRRADARARADIARGFEVVRTLGAFDMGQSVVVSNGAIEAIEGVEGTDRMLARVTAARAGEQRSRPPLGVLVKRSKPGQDLRIDVPTIGPQTAIKVHEAGLEGMAVEAGRAHAAERAEATARADALGLFIEGIADEHVSEARGGKDPWLAPVRVSVLGRKRPAAHQTKDALKAAAAVRALAPFAVGSSVVTIRDHVIAVDTGEGATAAIQRAASLRPWSSLTFGRRGFVALRDGSDLTPTVLAALADKGFAGAAVLAGEVPRSIIEDADQRALQVLKIETEDNLVR